MNNDKQQYVDEILELVNELPPMPDNIITLRKICADPNSSLKNITPILEKDPGFCADILHMANSAYFGVHHTVESIGEAVRYIGFESIVDFVAISFSHQAIENKFKNLKNLNEYFKHSNEIALAIKCLSKVSKKKASIQEFFTIAGLLHDIGRLVIMMVSDVETLKKMGSNWKHKPDLAQLEADIFGVDHCEVGKQICEKWHFSDDLQIAIQNHHVPLKGEFSECAIFILLSHFISMMDLPIEQVQSLLSEDIMDKIGLNKEMLIKAREMYTEKA